jgi:hypothetical protein
MEVRGCAVNYPGNPRFRPRAVHKIADSSEEMHQKEQAMADHAVVISDEGPMEVRSREEVKEIIFQHFGIRKHEFSVTRSSPEAFVAFFHETHARDVVFAAGRVVDGPIELRFHEWGLDRFGDRELLPYHVELSLEGIPHHAWFREIAEKILCDEAIIRHVEDTERHLDYRVCQCWAVCRDPSRIPQMVFMSLAKHETDPRRNAQVHIVRPRAALHSNVFKILVHIDVVEDLMFYHYPREELIADDKVPWRDFNWQFGRADGDLDEEELHPPRSICEPDEGRYHRHPRDDEDNQDRSRKRPHPRGFFSRMSGCLDTRGRSRDRNQERSSSRGWQRGESSGTRFRAAWDCSPPPGRHNPDPAVKRALAEMWKEKGVLHGQTSMQDMGECTARSEAILIIPQDNATWSEQLAGENVSPAVNNMLGEGEEFVPSASEVVRDKAEKGEESARVTHLGGHGRWGSRQTNILIVPQGNMFRAGQEHGSKGPSVVLSEEASEGRVDSGTLNSTREIR